MHLPSPLLTLLLTLTTTLAFSAASPQPALVPDASLHLVPHHTLFLRQLSNLQTFSSALGGFAAPAITDSGDQKQPFRVEDDKFTDFRSAGQRSCDRQFTACSEAANREADKGVLKVAQCEDQKGEFLSRIFIFQCLVEGVYLFFMNFLLGVGRARMEGRFYGISVVPPIHFHTFLVTVFFLVLHDCQGKRMSESLPFFRLFLSTSFHNMSSRTYEPG